MPEKEEQTIRDLLDHCERLPVTDRIAQRAAIIARTRKKKMPDLILAATAIELGIPLITKNIKDFRNIPNLKVKTSL